MLRFILGPCTVLFLATLTACAGGEPGVGSASNGATGDGDSAANGDGDETDGKDENCAGDTDCEDQANGDVGGELTGDGDEGAAGDGDGGSNHHDDDPALCHLKGSQVAVFGDSFIALDPSYILLDSHPFVRNLEDLAREAGALAMGDAYRKYAQSGSSLAYEPLIPAQFDRALQEDPDIKPAIMNGGGNDVLVNNRACLEFATAEELVAHQACLDVIDKALAAANTMLAKAADAGVKAVVLFFYPHLPGAANGGIGAGSYPNTILDYAHPKVEAMCNAQRGLRCHYVDLRPAFDTDNDGIPDPGMANIDGIHPTYASSEVSAGEVWKVMQEHCLASEP